jgi:hypothetical protein
MQNQMYSNKSGKPEKQPSWSDKMLARVKGIWPKFSIEKSASEYGPDFDAMANKFSMPVVEDAITRLKRSVTSDDPPAIGAFWDTCQAVSNEQIQSCQPLYDKNCENCDEGWELVGWSYFGPKYRNKLIKLYGFEKAQTMDAPIRCRVCWRGKKPELTRG